MGAFILDEVPCAGMFRQEECHQSGAGVFDGAAEDDVVAAGIFAAELRHGRDHDADLDTCITEVLEFGCRREGVQVGRELSPGWVLRVHRADIEEFTIVQLEGERCDLLAGVGGLGGGKVGADLGAVLEDGLPDRQVDDAGPCCRR